MVTRKVQIQVGIFLLIGLLGVGGTVAYFGHLGDSIRKMYEVEVVWENASNLIRGGKVMLAGTKVGTVLTTPRINPDMRGVTVILGIYDSVKIPVSAQFRIEISGLLGDRFVDINIPADTDTTVHIEPGMRVRGHDASGGFSALADSANVLAGKADILATNAGNVMEDVRIAIKNINAVAEKVDQTVLDEETIKQFKTTLENLSQVSGTIASMSSKVDALTNQAGDLMGQAKGTLTTIDESLKKIDGAVLTAKSGAEEFRKTMIEARALATDTRGLVGKTKNGGGVIDALLSDKEMAANLKAFVKTLRTRGILWYKDAKEK